MGRGEQHLLRNLLWFVYGVLVLLFATQQGVLVLLSVDSTPLIVEAISLCVTAASHFHRCFSPTVVVALVLY